MGGLGRPTPVLQLHGQGQGLLGPEDLGPGRGRGWAGPEGPWDTLCFPHVLCVCLGCARGFTNKSVAAVNTGNVSAKVGCSQALVPGILPHGAMVTSLPPPI